MNVNVHVLQVLQACLDSTDQHPRQWVALVGAGVEAEAWAFTPSMACLGGNRFRSTECCAGIATIGGAIQYCTGRHHREPNCLQGGAHQRPMQHGIAPPVVAMHAQHSRQHCDHNHHQRSKVLL